MPTTLREVARQLINCEIKLPPLDESLTDLKAWMRERSANERMASAAGRRCERVAWTMVVRIACCMYRMLRALASIRVRTTHALGALVS